MVVPTLPVDFSRERPLPANPNCVSFAGDALDVLAGRPWDEVLMMGWEVVKPFHRLTGFDVVVGFGWRVHLDRKNRRRAQATLFCLFDGVATAGQLERLEASAAGAPVKLSRAMIERVPTQGVPSFVVFDGAPHHLWTHRSGRPCLRRLGWRGEGVKAFADYEIRTPLPEWPHVLGVAPKLSDDDRELERLRLAFAQHYAGAIIEADDQIDQGEVAFMEAVFPVDLFERLGLHDVAVQGRYFARAQVELADRLGHHDKLALVGLFFSACYSDGSLDAREMRVLRQAGRELGLAEEQVVDYLRRFW